MTPKRPENLTDAEKAAWLEGPEGRLGEVLETWAGFDDLLLPFKAGIFHVAEARPEVELVPVWIENLNRVMPKGEFVPVPLLCTLTFGEPLKLQSGEDRAAFLDRASSALLALCPPRG